MSMTGPSCTQPWALRSHRDRSDPSTRYASRLPLMLYLMPYNSWGVRHVHRSEGEDQIGPGETAVELPDDEHRLRQPPLVGGSQVDGGPRLVVVAGGLERVADVLHPRV